MVRRQTLVPALAVMASFALAACSESVVTQPGIEPGQPLLNKAGAAADRQYVIVGEAGALPSDLAARVTAAGGTLVSEHSAIGVAVARGGRGFAAVAAQIAGVESVVPDLVYHQAAPQRVVDLTSDMVNAAVASSADNDQFYFLQWAPAAIQAPEAWNAGYKGAGVRVAILDGGLFNAHPELAANVDVAKSKSFACARPPAPVQPPPPAAQVPWEDPPETCEVVTAFNSDHGTFWHGTHVAGIVGALDNGPTGFAGGGTIGIAPRATLIGVKVLDGGSGHFSWIIDGIMYAARPIAEGGAGAQVINMSLGALIEMSPEDATKEEIKELAAGVRALDKAISRATAYAWDRGVTVIGAAGNDATHLGKEFVAFPSMTQKVISVAATGPMGWALGNSNFSRQASYTNFGKQGVDLAAPGGDAALPGNAACKVTSPTIPAFSLTNPCWIFDMYLSTSRAGLSWAVGTSMASPVVSGVAALIIGKYNGMITPAGVKALLQQGATDFGKSGNDDVYGKGFVNAWNSVR